MGVPAPLVASGGVIHLHDIGFTPAHAASTIAVLVSASLVCNLLAGVLGDRVPPHRIGAVAMLALLLGLLPGIRPSTEAGLLAFAVPLGLGYGASQVCLMSLLANYYGSRGLTQLANRTPPRRRTPRSPGRYDGVAHPGQPPRTPMHSPDENTSAPHRERHALPLLLVAISLALGWILLPFYGTILWGAIIALLFAPLNRWLLRRLKYRPTPAALLTILVVLVIVVVPFALVSVALAREAAGLYARVQSGESNPVPYLQGVFDALPGWATAFLDRLGLVDFDALRSRLSSVLERGSAFIAAQAFNLGQNTFEFAVSLFITLYLAFFLVRDGDRIVRALRRALPLTPGQQQELLHKFGLVIRSTVRGNLIVAATQGALGGLAFWFLGVTGPLLWAVVMAFLSLLPALGAALVWLPVAIWLFATGAIWQGIALVAWGVLVIGLVDNLLRPMLVGKATLMPDYVVMITTLGGMVVFGINGFVLGPVIAAMFFAVWHLYLTTREGAEPPASPPAP